MAHIEPTNHGEVRIHIAGDIGGHQWIFAQPITGALRPGATTNPGGSAFVTARTPNT